MVNLFRIDDYDWREHKWISYTRSRDALKSIRPEGWAILRIEQSWKDENRWWCDLHNIRYQNNDIHAARENQALREELAGLKANKKRSKKP